ncbi:zinc-dependent metalloprotease family protein [Ilumatobacter sp.]|uniref:zinc-dependent metalloprotease family protein n=1 Tax=Ilumatobacter sp. TaxID=1967498 RepID=UPI003B529594
MALVALAAGSSVPVAVGASDDGAGRLLHDEPVPELSFDEVIEVIGDPHLEFDHGLVRAIDPPQLELPAGVDDPGGDPSGQRSLARAAGFEAISASDALSLHSKPGSTRTVFLDLDGHVTTGTAWNSGLEDPKDRIESGPYSREPLGSEDDTLSSHELEGIVDIFERVAEDFAPWDIDVTTQDPGVDALAKSSASDQRYGVRVVISPDYTWLDSRRFGGVAYVGSFDKYDLPAFVFSSNLAQGNPKSVAEAVSHEVGHALGLTHDGIHRSGESRLDYYDGHGDWAPIMGVGYRRPITQWSRGEYTGATNKPAPEGSDEEGGDDDLEVIDSHLTRRPDDSGATVLGASDTSTRHTLSVGGATARHRLVTAGGRVEVSVERWHPLGNLLAELRIRDASGTVVAVSRPSDPASWSLSATLADATPSAEYTVEVRSVGWGTADDGFTAYASIGEYVLGVDVERPSGPVTPTTVPSGGGGSSSSTPPPSDAGTTTTVPRTDPRPADTGHRLTATRPRRILDTRTDPAIGRLAAGETVRVAVAGVPSTSTAVVANVAAVRPGGPGFVSVTPCTGPVGATSSLNYLAGRNVANSITTPLSGAGELCVHSSAATDIVLDVTGWIGPDGETALQAIEAVRAVDTRIGIGLDGRLVAGRRGVIELRDVIGAETGAVAVNVTAVNPSASGFVSVDDCSEQATESSALNFTAGRTRGNNGVFAVGSRRRLCVTSSVATHLTVDVTGRFGAGDGLTFVPAEPARVLDTRSSGRLSPGASTGVEVPSPSTPNGLTARPVAASVNITAALHDSGGYVTAWGCGPRPTTSALNPVAGIATANSALVPLTDTGRTCMFHANGGHLIVDLAGWWV